MILFAAYLLLLCFLIYRNGFFGIFNDDTISRKSFAAIFFLKALAVPVFYYLFKIMYGGIDDLDAGKFFHDSVVMNRLLYTEPAEFFKMLFGLQDDSPGSLFFNTAIVPTHNWDNGQLKDFFYNDNRIVIRIHSILEFLAQGSYFAHALFACFFGMLGFTLIYKSLKNYFPGKESWLMLLLCFFPALWLYSAAVLKEPYTILILGSNLYVLKGFFSSGSKTKWILLLIPLSLISLLLKPYILFYALLFFLLFHLVDRYARSFKIPVFLIALLLSAFFLNTAATRIKGRSLGEAALERKREFADMSKGGIFLMDRVKFLRLKYDHGLLNRIGNKEDSSYTIKRGVAFFYWEHSHQQDTLYTSFNEDTLTVYKLVYEIPEAKSNFDIGDERSGLLMLGLKGLYFATLHPFFFNAKGMLQQVLSLENLLLLLSFAMVVAGMIRRRRPLFFPLTLFLFSLSLLLLIGVTTPNSGALMRYRSPAAIFMIAAALYFLCDKNKKQV